MPNRTRRSGKRSSAGGVSLRGLLRPEIIGVVLLVLSLLTLISLLPFQRGALMKWWLTALHRAVGIGVWLMPLAFFSAGLTLVFRGLGRQVRVDPEQPAGAVILALLVLALWHLLAGGSDPRGVAAAGRGGGFVGYGIGQVLVHALGTVGAVLVLVALGIISLMLLLGTSLREMVSLVAGAARRAWGHRIRLPHASLGKGTATRPGSATTEVASPHATPGLTTAERVWPVSHSPLRGGERAWRLPAVDEILGTSAEVELSKEEIRERVRVIEQTLDSFGVPAKVVEVNQGPTITQFGVEPGYVERRNSDGRLMRAKIKVSRIASLANDLALALAASPIRIEAPVPGRSVVGIEVPNSEIALVSLRSVLESDTYKQIKGGLPIALGQDVAGNPIAADLASMPHLLIAGATGSGKSVCINAIIASLLCTRTPDQVQFIMIDPKMVELVPYNGIPHLRAPVVIELERVVSVLNWATREMDGRYRQFNQARARNLEVYNQQLLAKGQKALPYVIVVIDELADLMMVAPDEVERSVCRIAQMARATGIHLVIATQRPSVDVVTGLIKANFPARISFAVTSQVDSRVIIDTAGADKLLGRGDMLFMPADSSKLQRLQGCYVSDKELAALVRHWRGENLAQEPLSPEEVVQGEFWPEAQAQESAAAQQDDLLPRAIALVQEQGRASISMLQRRLRIGYSRAAKLVDLMAEQGLVGPEQGCSRPREVLGPVGATGERPEYGEEDGLPPL